MQADTNTKNITGDYESPIFSYVKVADSRAEVKAFGESFSIDLDKISFYKIFNQITPFLIRSFHRLSS
jgi:hypothetical protein